MNPVLGTASLPAMVHQFGPTPTNDPCVPCEIPPRTGSQSALLRLGKSHALPAGHQILDVYLFTGSTYYPLEASDQADLLQRLGAGELSAVRIEGFDDHYLHPWDEALLVYIIGLEGRTFWTSAPINVLP